MLGIRWPADEPVFRREMRPRLLIIGHDPDRVFEAIDRLAVSSLCDIGEAEMFPNWRVVRIEAGALPQVLDRCFGVAGCFEAIAEL